MEENFQFVKVLKEVLEKKFLLKLKEQENLAEYLSNVKREDTLKEALYVLVDDEDFRRAVIVRDEMVRRGLDTTEKSSFEEIQDKLDDWLSSQS